MSTSTTSTPRGEARRRAFLDAALKVFMEHGLGAASVNDVVRLAGGSLATLYAQFGSKEGLFLAMFAERVDRLLEPLQQISASHLPLRDGLQEIGARFTRATLSNPEAAAISRIVLTEAKTYPEVAKKFMELGPERVRAAVRSYLEERMAAGEVRDIDPDWCASYFIELVRARHAFASIMTPNYQLTDEEVAASVARAVDIFVDGVRPR